MPRHCCTAWKFLGRVFRLGDCWHRIRFWAFILRVPLLPDRTSFMWSSAFQGLNPPGQARVRPLALHGLGVGSVVGHFGILLTSLLIRT